MEEKKLSLIHHEIGTVILSSISEDQYWKSKMVAVYLADTNTLKAYKQKGPDVLIPLISQAEDMEDTEAAEVLNFFTKRAMNFGKISNKDISTLHQ